MDFNGVNQAKKENCNRRLFQSGGLGLLKGMPWTPILGLALGLDAETITLPVDTACPPNNGQNPACTNISSIGIIASGEKPRNPATNANYM